MKHKRNRNRKHVETLDQERERILSWIRDGDKRCFMHASQELRSDREVALAAVSLDGHDIRFVSAPELKDDEDIVMAAVKGHNHGLKYASARLQAHRSIVMAAVNRDGYALQFASTELRADYDIVKEAVSTCGLSLRFASSQLRAERDIVFTAVGKDPCALKFAGGIWKANHSLVLSAVRRKPGVFRFAAISLRRAHDFVARAITVGNDGVLHAASKEIKGDLRDTASKFETFTDAHSFLHGSLQIHSAFLEFLCCVASKSAAVSGNPVTKVNLDKITSEKLHRHIAEYAGVPLGQGLEPVRLVKRVMPILVAVVVHRDDDCQNLRCLLEYCKDI